MTIQSSTGGRALRAERPRAVLAAILLVLALLVTGPAISQAADCERRALPAPLAWSTSGAWLGSPANDGTLLIAQGNGQAVIDFVANGATGPVDKAGRDAFADLGRISRVRAAGGRVFVEDAENDRELLRYRRVENRLEPAGRVEIPDEIVALYDWAPVGGGIVALADYYGAQCLRQDNQCTGFVYFEGSGSFVHFVDQGRRGNARTFYARSTSQYIASAGNTAFVLLLDDGVRIARLDPATPGVPDILEHFPTGFDTLPTFLVKDHWPKPRKSTAYYQAFERSRSVVGLFADSSGKPHVLVKQPARENGATDWWLIEVKPNNGRPVARRLLPTDAAHLTLVPPSGDPLWTLLEKSPVQAVGPSGGPDMTIRSAVVVDLDQVDKGGRVTVSCPTTR